MGPNGWKQGTCFLMTSVCVHVYFYSMMHTQEQQKHRDLCEFGAVLHRDFQASKAVQRNPVLKIKRRAWRDGAVIKSTGCFDSQQSMVTRHL